MNDSPSFTKLDVDRILRRAAEIEGSDDSGPVTVDEIRSIAREAGFGLHAVDRAIGEARQAAVTVRRHPIQKSGIVVACVSAVRTIPIEISSEELMRAVRLLQPYREGPAQVRLGEDQVRWRDRRGLRFAVVSSRGVTEIRVQVSRPMIRRGRWIGWVKSAADRLEQLVLLVAAQDLADSTDTGRSRANDSARVGVPEIPVRPGLARERFGE
jgi:hypothetical protein